MRCACVDPQMIQHRVCSYRLIQTFPTELQRCGVSVSNVVRVSTMINGPVHLCIKCVKGVMSSALLLGDVSSDTLATNQCIMSLLRAFAMMHSIIFSLPILQGIGLLSRGLRVRVPLRICSPQCISRAMHLLIYFYLSLCLSDGECADVH